MAETPQTVADIIAEARDKYTIHNCNECVYRKSCDLNANGFDSDKCKGRRQSIMLGFGIEDGYFTGLLDRLEAAHECDNAAAAREALIHVDKLAREFALGNYYACDFPNMLIDVVRSALSAPPRNCDRPECATTKAAQDVWRKEDGGKTAYYEWLLAPATAKEGGEE